MLDQGDQLGLIHHCHGHSAVLAQGPRRDAQPRHRLQRQELREGSVPQGLATGFFSHSSFTRSFKVLALKTYLTNVTIFCGSFVPYKAKSGWS